MPTTQLGNKRMRETTGRGYSKSKKGRREVREAPRSRAAELDEEWEALLEEEQNALLSRLAGENRQLDSTLQYYQAKLESIILCSKECLENTQDIKMDNKISSDLLQDLNEKAATVDQAFEPASKETSIKPPSTIGPFINYNSSVIYQAGHLSNHNSTVDTLSPNDLCEAIMAWKVRGGQGWGFNWLLFNFQLDELTSLFKKDSTIELLRSPDFYSNLLQSIHWGTKLVMPSHIDEHDVRDTPSATGMVYQRRSVAFCTYIVMRQFRPCHSSQLVYIVQFWFLFCFFMFLTFPTEENLRKLPKWLWPLNCQLCQDHPGTIDFVLWPELRSTLTRKWLTYDLTELLVELIRNLDFQYPTDDFHENTIRLAPDGSNFELDPDFGEAIFDLSQHRVDPMFFKRYPELSDCFAYSETIANT